MNVFALAKLYYPRLWDEQRLLMLVQAGKLTEEERQAILQGVSAQE